MTARFFCPNSHDQLWQPDLELDLPQSVVRHVQVLRHQPGDEIIVFQGHAQQWWAEITHMGRSSARARLLHSAVVHSELPQAVHLAIGMPANERMDGLVEKATELGVHTVWPLHTQRSVLRLQGERATKKIAHWQGVAIAAAEQSGRSHVPQIMPVQNWAAFWQTPPGSTSLARPIAQAFVLSLQDLAQPWWASCQALSPQAILLSSGPEGGLSAEEEQMACAGGAQPVNLGPRVLRADTAPLQALGVLSAYWSHP